jgi:hypothetical protein
LVLLPMMVSGTYTFDAYFNYKNQLQFLMDVLEKVPQDIGVVVTTHPDYDILDEGKLAFLRRQYPHFIYEPIFAEYYAPSQYLIRHVDAVINATSTSGVQALIWDKKLIALNSRYFGFLADGQKIDDLSQVLQAPLREKQSFLYWILTHFAIPSFLIHDGKWLVDFFQRCLIKKQQGIDASFYDQLADEEWLLTNYQKNLDANIPQPSKPEAQRSALRQHVELQARYQTLESERNKLKEDLSQLQSYDRQLETENKQLAGKYQELVREKQKQDFEWKRWPYRVIRQFVKLRDRLWQVSGKH